MIDKAWPLRGWPTIELIARRSSDEPRVSARPLVGQRSINIPMSDTIDFAKQDKKDEREGVWKIFLGNFCDQATFSMPLSLRILSEDRGRGQKVSDVVSVDVFAKEMDRPGCVPMLDASL